METPRVVYLLCGWCCNPDLTLWEPGLGGLERRDEHQGHFTEDLASHPCSSRDELCAIELNLSGPQFLFSKIRDIYLLPRRVGGKLEL